MADTPISDIEDIIEDARQGRPFILVDAEDRENEGDVIISAQFATPDQINFMAKHARGLVCLAITAARSKQLRLPPMSHENLAEHGTAFTVSIEAREGVTTGISAHDRAHTVAVAVDPTKNSDDVVSPGHVFPLVAREGGVRGLQGVCRHDVHAVLPEHLGHSHAARRGRVGGGEGIARWRGRAPHDHGDRGDEKEEESAEDPEQGAPGRRAHRGRRDGCRRDGCCRDRGCRCGGHARRPAWSSSLGGALRSSLSSAASSR